MLASTHRSLRSCLLALVLSFSLSFPLCVFRKNGGRKDDITVMVARVDTIPRASS